MPFRQFVVKLHSRCNLACDYCYVYTMADQRWRSRPKVMPPAVIEQTAVRIAEHARTHSLERVDLVIHGGEPLLAGANAISYLVKAVRMCTEAPVRVIVQTNGILLDRALLELFRDLDVRIGVSVDGTAEAHDRHRVRRDGSGTYAEVDKVLSLISTSEYRPVFAGLLCTVDLRNDPVETYEALLRYNPPIIDFLLPHGNWIVPPPRRRPGAPETPYADWLIAVFERWFGAPLRETRIRRFEEIIHVLLGGQSGVESVGVSPVSVVVVETDGTIEQSDALSSAFEGAADTGLHVGRDSFDAALRLPDFLAQSMDLAPVCRACDLRTVCGGGLRAHRFGGGDSFDRPSVYCPDLEHLIRHIRARLVEELAGIR